MTDKQIIIDGVDVADCEHINACDKKMKCVILQDDVCETNPYCEGFNCYFKQLKVKEQENEELKNRLKYIRGENICLKENATDEQIDSVALNNYIKTLEFQASKLKAENDELKEKYEQEKDLNKEMRILYEKFNGNSLIENSAKRKSTR